MNILALWPYIKTLTMGDNTYQGKRERTLGQRISENTRYSPECGDYLRYIVIHFSKLTTVKNFFTREMDTTRNFRLYWKASHNKVRCQVELK